MATEITPPTDSGQPHPYHLVRPSPWPFLSSMMAAVMLFGAAWWMHDGPWYVFALGLAGVLFAAFCWWRDIIHEGVKEKAHGPVVLFGLRYGMLLFIASEVMFFFAFFWAFFNASLFPREFSEGVWAIWHHGAEGTWPPENIEPFDPFHLPIMMTFVLLLSGSTVTWAHHALQDGYNKSAAQALAITVGLGILFTCLQAYEYGHAAFGLSDGIYPSTFYLATGFHGLHVIIGTIFLAVVWWQTTKGHFTKDNHFGFEAAAWYWHFVDVVWLFLFVSIYWWGAGGGGH